MVKNILLKNKKRIIIMGAAGRDFHVFNMLFRDKPDFEVVCFTATQIPFIEKRIYPPQLAGKLYPKGIKIELEEKLSKILKMQKIDEVIFAYSDVTFDYIEEKRKLIESFGAEFSMFPIEETMLKSKKPVIAVCAVRTGCGKSPATRRVANILKKMGKKVAVVRHPMPYGNLASQAVQRFSNLDDLVKHKCTIEEMEEYEPHILNDVAVFAGVDYEKILKEAEKEADVLIWDGGNNDTPFIKPDLWLTVADPHRPGHELAYFPGKENFLRADVIIINKVDSAKKENIEIVKKNAQKYNSKAKIILAKSDIFCDNPELLKNKNVLVVEDGPTLTHGGMKYGAGYIAALRFKAKKIIDPRHYASGTLKDVFKKYPKIGKILPAMGYSSRQLEDLEKTINKTRAEAVVIATPVNLNKILKINKTMAQVRVTYELNDFSKPNLEDIINSALFL